MKYHPVSDQPNIREVQSCDVPECTSGIRAKDNVEVKEVKVDITPIDTQPTVQVRDTTLSVEDIDFFHIKKEYKLRHPCTLR